MSGKTAKAQRRQLSKVIDQSGLTEAELAIAIQQYKQRKADYKQAKQEAKPGDWIITRLPGADLEITDSERLSLAAQAQRENIHTGHYEDLEIVQFGNLVARKQTERVVAEVIAEAEEVLEQKYDLFILMISFDRLIDEIDYSAAVWSGDDLRQRLTKEVMGELGDLYIQLCSVAKQSGSPTEPLTVRFMPRVNAIQELIEGNDDGSLLKKIARNRKGRVAEIDDWRDTLKLAGRQPHSTEKPIDYLCHRVVEIQNSQGGNREEAYDELFSELDQDHQKGIKEKAWEKLCGWSDPKGNLWRNVDRRKQKVEQFQDIS